MDRYVITLRGEAGPTVLAAFDDFDMTVGQDVTVLRGELRDRAALYGLIQRLQDFGIEILEVRREEAPATEHNTASPTHEG